MNKKKKHTKGAYIPSFSCVINPEIVFAFIMDDAKNNKLVEYIIRIGLMTGWMMKERHLTVSDGLLRGSWLHSGI